MTFVVSDINAKELLKSEPCLVNDDYKAANKYGALPMFTIGSDIILSAMRNTKIR